MKAVQLNSYINVKSAEKCLQFGLEKCKTLSIAHKSARTVVTELYIDHWSIKHDDKGHLREQFEGKKEIENVSEQKYLGFIISEDGSNQKNIEAKRKRAFGIIKVIQFLVQGLGKYTIECGMIYLNSLLRSSILFASETMYDIKENDFRQLERIEEDMLRKLFKTGRGCPIFQLYLESGHLPARFYIKRTKLVFYHYILNQKEDSMIFQFLMAQKRQPRRGDWCSEIQTILEEFQLNLSEDEIKRIPASQFKKMVKSSASIAGIRYLNLKQQKGTKGSLINYDSLECQDYLNPCSNLTIKEQRYLFSLRSEMNPLSTNFNRNKNINPIYCVNSCKTILDNQHLVFCPILNQNSEINFLKILNGTISDKKEALHQTMENERIRNLKIENETL